MPRKIANSGFSNWSPKSLPDLTGKTYLISGGNVGLGFETAKHLGRAGGDVILACHTPKKAEKAKKDLLRTVKGKVDLVELDLADLSSVRAAAAQVREKYSGIDGLINNAGIMQTPQLETKDGFEMQLGTNHLGHFLWTSLLMDLVEATGGRVAVVSSLVHLQGKINFDDLMLKDSYTPTKAYCQSKLANLMFAFELDRRLATEGSSVTSIACHPGYSATKLQSTGPVGVLNAVYKFTNLFMAQSAAKGSIPTVLATAGLEAKRGAYYGPLAFGGMVGRVGDAQVAERALDEDVAAQLWEESEKLVGESFLMPA